MKGKFVINTGGRSFGKTHLMKQQVKAIEAKGVVVVTYDKTKANKN